MKQIKIIFINMKFIMLAIVIVTLSFTDWKQASDDGSLFIYQALIVMSTILSVIFQSEEDKIED